MRISRRLLLLAFLILETANPAISDEPEVFFEARSIRGKVLVQDLSPERRLQLGDRLSEGMTIRSGWRSAAELVADSAQVEIRLSNRTRVAFSTETDGALLALEKGRIRAKLVPPSNGDRIHRMIETPQIVVGSLGSEYGLSVDRKGNTLLVVFSGSVEVSFRNKSSKPLRVSAGFYIWAHRNQPDEEPQRHTIERESWDHGEVPWPWDAMSDWGDNAAIDEPAPDPWNRAEAPFRQVDDSEAASGAHEQAIRPGVSVA